MISGCWNIFDQCTGGSFKYSKYLRLQVDTLCRGFWGFNLRHGHHARLLELSGIASFYLELGLRIFFVSIRTLPDFIMGKQVDISDLSF